MHPCMQYHGRVHVRVLGLRVPMSLLYETVRVATLECMFTQLLLLLTSYWLRAVRYICIIRRATNTMCSVIAFAVFVAAGILISSLKM